MIVVSTGASIFQVNASKLRIPLDTVDMEELPDSRERAGAPVLWLSCEGQKDVWSCSLTFLIQVLFLTDKDFWLQPQWTSEPRRLRASRHCSCRAFGQSSRKRIPRSL